MKQPLFDFDLKRVSREHYITGKAAINFPHVGITTGGWHLDLGKPKLFEMGRPQKMEAWLISQ